MTLALDQLCSLVTEGRLRGALEELNLRSGCRFTAFYRFSDTDLRNLLIIDRLDAHAPTMSTAPIEQTYCAFVQQSNDAFLVAYATEDARLVDHPKRQVIRTYVGFPVLAGGALFGTVCHFDHDVIRVDPDVVALTRAFAAALDPQVALAGLQQGLDRRLESLRLLCTEIRLASNTPDEACEAFEEYAQPLRLEAKRLLEPAGAFDFHTSIDTLMHSFGMVCPAPGAAVAPVPPGLASH